MTSDELKQALGQSARQIIAEGLNLVENSNKKVLCPLHSEKTPSMSWFTDGLMWRCHGCDGRIDIYDYFTKFQRMTFVEAKEKVAKLAGMYRQPVRAEKPKYLKPNIKIKDMEQPFIDYMGKRKITKETLDFWRVAQTTWTGAEVYVFQYFNDKKELEYVSYRGLGKDAIKGGAEKDTKPILWGMWHVDKSKPLVVTEGQPDAMAVWQAGYKNVVSVPNGANNFRWIETCWTWLQGVSEIIVFADNDEVGLKMSNEIKRRLKNVKIVYSDKRKDANEILFFDGPQDIISIIEEAIRVTPPGIIDLANKEYIPTERTQLDTIETGFYEYDSHVEDWKEQELTVIFGRNGEGKTTFISQIIAHCLEKNIKVLLYSGEMSDQKIQNWLYKQLIGGKKEHLRTITTKYKNKIEPKAEAIRKIKEWHKGKLFLVDRSEKEVMDNMDKFFSVMEIAVKKFGVKLVVIDNLMAVLEENADSLFSDQANFVQRCKNFAIDNFAHVVLLSHPNKEKREITNAEKGNLEKTDISGSNNIPNKADNIIAIERNWAEDGLDAVVTSLKDRESGARKTMLYYFSKNTLRFFNAVTKEDRMYSWDDDNIPPWEKE